MTARCYEKVPPGFFGDFQIVVICVLENEDKEVLFLLRNDQVPQPYAWGLPAGKRKDRESPKRAVCRKTKKETGIDLKYSEVKFLTKLYARYPNQDMVVYVFKHKIEKDVRVLHDVNKYQNFLWMRPADALDNFPLVEGLGDCLNYCLGLK